MFSVGAASRCSASRLLHLQVSTYRTTKPPAAAVATIASNHFDVSATLSPVHQHQQHQVRYRSNRSRRGLYDGKDIRSGNNVSFSMKSTKRKFKPNVFVKRVYSEILDDMIKFHLTTSTLRSIDKVGGLDNYLLKNRSRITEGEGYKIRKKIEKRLKNQAYWERKKANADGATTDDTA